MTQAVDPSTLIAGVPPVFFDSGSEPDVSEADFLHLAEQLAARKRAIAEDVVTARTEKVKAAMEKRAMEREAKKERQN
eukprot:5984436-Pyramimonas_sp.AAC.1